MTETPILIAHINERRAVALRSAVEALTAAQAAGSIPNPTYIGAKDTISRAVEEAWRVVSEVKPRTGEMPRNVGEWIWALPTPYSGVATFARSLTKKLANHPDHPAIVDFVKSARAFAAEIAPLGALITDLKDKTVKRAPAGSGEPKYVAPPATSEAMRRIHETLEGMVAEAHAGLVARFIEGDSKVVAAFRAAQEASEKGDTLSPHEHLEAKGWKNRYGRVEIDEDALRVLLDVTVRQHDPRYVEPTRYLISPETDAIIERNARKSADAIRDRFVYKNVTKLDSIVEKKGNLRSAEVIGREVHLGGMTGTMRFVFEDGSAFTVKNAMVWSQSVHGRVFPRFPLTFHGVVLADGSPMRQPSEEKMNKHFGG